MRWAARTRMAFIRDRLAVVGELNRGSIMERFGVSQPQASADIKKFRALYPDEMRYDSSKKCFVATRPPSVHARDTTAAALSLANAGDEWLAEIAQRDPSMIRDVAAALIYERTQ